MGKTTFVKLLTDEERKSVEEEFLADLENIRNTAKRVNDKWLDESMHSKLVSIMVNSDDAFVDKVNTLYNDIDNLVAMKL